MATTHVLLVSSDARRRPALVKMLLGAGYLVAVAQEWNEGLSRSGEDFDVVVVDFTGDICASGAGAVLTQFRARRQPPVLAMVAAQDCARLRSRAVSPGVRAIPRMGLLEELRALERRPPETPQQRPGTDQFRRQPASRSTVRSSSSSTFTSQETATLANGESSPLDQFRAEELLAPGTMLDKYRIEAHVGKGGFAHVYRATHLVLGMACALKVLKQGLAQAEPQVVEGFCTEARNAIRISHPNVVRVHDVTRGDRHTYLVMEWIDGLSLSDILASTGRIPAYDALRIGIAVCSGLEAALAHGTIHRDVKPGNILLANDGTVKLVDFGLAKNLRQAALQGTADASRIVGTPSYMSPEQAFSPDTVDCRSDMYSLGATLFHACAGRTPFAGEDAIQMLLCHRDQPIPELTDSAADCPDEVVGLIARMLAKDPQKRFSSYAELRSRMQALLDGLIADGTATSNGWSSVYLRKRAAPVVA